MTKYIALILVLTAYSAFADDGEHSVPIQPQNPLIDNSASSSPIRNVPSAIAPSVSNSQACPMVTMGSKAGSVFFLSASGTHEPSIVPICVAWHLKQLDVVEKMTCAISQAYAKANPVCSVVSK